MSAGGGRVWSNNNPPCGDRARRPRTAHAVRTYPASRRRDDRQFPAPNVPSTRVSRLVGERFPRIRVTFSGACTLNLVAELHAARGVPAASLVRTDPNIVRIGGVGRPRVSREEVAMSPSTPRRHPVGRFMYGLAFLVGLTGLAFTVWVNMAQIGWQEPAWHTDPQEAFVHGSIGTELAPLV